MRLIYERGGEKIAFPIDDGETYIGRKEDCDIYFPDGSLSKRHARLVRDGGRLVLHDAGSRNGTLVNGKVAQGPTQLRDGDVIQCGKLEFRVEGVGGGGDDDFAVVDEESEGRGSRGSRAGAVGATASAPVAKAVRSGEVRGSVLDEFPEVPKSGEGASPLAAAPAPRLRLVEGGPERIYELTGDTVTIGSKPENTIVLTGDGISRYHAEVAREGAAWVLKDLGARNGLFVAGKKIDLHELQDGDEVQIGNSKLRFEVPRASALSGVLELARRLKADPVGTYKADPRVRTGAAATVVAMVLLMLALPGGAMGTSQKALDLAWAETGTRELERRDYKAARDVFRKAQATLPADQVELARALMDLATQWVELEKGPMQFRWAKAEERILACTRITTLPKSTRAWLEGQLGTVRLNREAYDKLVEAEAAGAQAAQLAEEKKFREALRQYDATVARYSEVAPQSAFGPRAAEQSRAVREQVFQLVLSDIRGRMSAAQPEWGGIIEFIGQAVSYAETNEQRALLQRLRGECDQNRQCEQYYQRAVDIVNQRDVDHYSDGLRLLEGVIRAGPSIKIYPDAQAYHQWIQADQLVRQAQRHYEAGEAPRAFRLLDQALQFDVLGPEARNSVKTRKTSWGRVVRAFDAGTELYAADAPSEELARNRLRAKEEFERVVQWEPNQRNLYHVRAVRHLRAISEAQVMTLEARLKSGLDALENGEFESAFQFFGQVMADPNRVDSHERTIREAVVDAAKRRALFRRAKNDFRNDRQENFIQVYSVTKLLKTWLPASDPQRAEAEKLCADVIKVLLRLKKIREAQGGGR